jgi:hypothetical protein
MYHCVGFAIFMAAVIFVTKYRPLTVKDVILSSGTESDVLLRNVA